MTISITDYVYSKDLRCLTCRWFEAECEGANEEESKHRKPHPCPDFVEGVNKD